MPAGFAQAPGDTTGSSPGACLIGLDLRAGLVVGGFLLDGVESPARSCSSEHSKARLDEVGPANDRVGRRVG